MKSSRSLRTALALTLSALATMPLWISPNAGAAGEPDIDLSIAKTDAKTDVVRGAATTYSITVTNPDAAVTVTDAHVVDTMPLGLTGVTWSCAAVSPSLCTSSGGTGDIDALVTLAPGATVTFTVAGTVVTADATLDNTATVTPPIDVVDTVTGNNTATDSDNVVDNVDLSVTIDDAKTQVVRGTTYTYVVTATNNSAVTVTAAHVTGVLPAGLTGATWTCTTCTPATGSGNVDALVTLAPGASETITVSATVAATAAGTLVNSAVVAVPTFGFVDLATANNSASDIDTFLVLQDLYAVKGSTTLPDGVSVPVWGYTGGAPATAPGGPTIVAYQGDAVQVTLHNNVGVDTGLLFPSVAMPSDTVGTATTKTYSFAAGKVGTSLYEAALLPGTEYQVAMGLYGPMIVRPAVDPNKAYLDSSTATGQDSSFTAEATLVLGEIDPALNNAADPATFDLRTFAPKYALINGKAYPNTDPILANAADRVLLRYVNAGLKLHSMALLGARQTIVAHDSIELKYPSTVVAQTFGPGETADVIATAATAGSKLFIYDGSLTQHNNAAAGVGGMTTFISVAGSVTPPTAPTTSNVAVSPNPANGTATVTVTATLSDSAATAEYFVDATGANGAGTALTGTGSVTGTIAAGLSSGTHVIYVHGFNGTWGPFASASLTIDSTGPATGNQSLTPALSNGSAAVVLKATGDDTATGGANVDSGSYAIDGGLAVALGLDGPVSAVTAFKATIPAATVAALTEGSHTIAVTTKDALGNTGAAANVALTVDKTGPTSSAASASKTPNNGTVPFNSSVPAVRVTATVTDATSSVAGAEGFFEVAGANGSGFLFSPVDGVWGGVSGNTEAVFADIPLATVAALSTGSHPIVIHAKDAAGNWGGPTTATLVVDKLGPVVSAVTSTPAASNNTAVAISASASDAATGGLNIAAAELFIDTAGASGTGTAMAGTGPGTVTITATIPAATVAALTAGVHTIRVHAKDAVGNWGALVNGTLLIDRIAPTFTGVTLTPNLILAGTSAANLAVVGAADAAPSSGLAGGEYWFDGTAVVGNVPATSFTGLTPTVATAALTPGPHSVRVRIRDNAGNWSTVRSVTLTVIADAIFANGFETGTTPWGWTNAATANTTRIDVTAAAALAGTRGLQVQGNNTNYVQYDFGTAANPATGTYDARFSFRPNGNNSAGKDIFAAATATNFNTVLFRVRYRLNLTTPQVQIQMGASTNTNWTNITGGTATNTIEVVWQSGTSLVLYINGVPAQTITATAGSVSSVRLGSVTNVGTAALMFFDAFASKRSVTPLLP